MEQIVIIEEHNDLFTRLQENNRYGQYSYLNYRFREFMQQLHMKMIIGCLLIYNKANETDLLTMCMRIREKGNVPVIVVTDKYDSYESAACLEIGADDYVEATIHPRDLLARIKAVRRRGYSLLTTNFKEHPIQVGPISIYTSRETVYKNKQLVDLNRREYTILLHFVNRIGEIVTREELMELIRVNKNRRLIDIYIHSMRAKLEEHPDFPKLIRTVKGKGYRMDVE
ncbi:response regulator transcription factor [Bacillus sp. RG28]|jgi:DNA-binding response OmpR family regulator|uniref:Response regulator transcription factor n=1 Tax=Gottfriedia endophytica TaxID=2820819 RepID=A0A940SJI3_9BACI|nr:response regulator transcription factor [Gottfriedia endophytica]MBP0726065.1 response regulator transcription factor [Gottfriedia endophytica]